MTAAGGRVLIVESRYYPSMADPLLDGAIHALGAAGVEWDIVSMPGLLELPAAISMADAAGRGPAGVIYGGYVALACVLRDELVSAGRLIDQAAHGLIQLSVARQLAIGQGLADVECEADGIRWAREADGGGAAARACLELMALRARLLGS
jgi:6,7-dimethyl-8-ribityllumazine synthase